MEPDWQRIGVGIGLVFGGAVPSLETRLRCSMILAGAIILAWPHLRTAGQRLVRISPDRHVGVLDALTYLGTRAKWAYRFSDRDEWLKQTETELRDLAANGNIVFWGRKLGDMWDREFDYKHPKLPIPQQFWKDGGDLNWFEILAAGPGPNQAWPLNREDKAGAYEEVSVLRTDLMRLFPRKRFPGKKPEFEPELRRHVFPSSTLADEQSL